VDRCGRRTPKPLASGTVGEVSRDLHALAARQAGVFSRADALRCGYTVDQIRHRLEVGRWLTVRRGVYAHAALSGDGPIPLHLRAAAACLVMPGAVIAKRTAAALHGVALIGEPGPVELLRGSDHHDGYDLVVRPAALPEHHVTSIRGLPVVTVARAVVDLCRGDLRDGLVAADSALHHRLVTQPQLQAVVRDCTKWPGVAAAREVVDLADGRAESALESVSRLFIHEQRLPPPRLQQWIRGFRVDFLWDGVVGEADGARKYDGRAPDALLAEKRRQERLEELGFIVVRWGWDDAVRRPEATADRIRRAIARADRLRRTA